jgi:hypothetical protein
MRTSKAWGLIVYEQDWLHNEWEKMDATLQVLHTIPIAYTLY